MNIAYARFIRRPGNTRRPPWLLIAIAGLAVLAFIQHDASVASASPGLQLSAPGQVQIGQAIQIHLTAVGVPEVAGFEMDMLFDDSAMDFNGAHFVNNDLEKIGRQVNDLITTVPGSGAAVGFYSCPFATCNGGARVPQGATGTLNLGTVSVLSRIAGRYEIKFDQVKFVDANGNRVNIPLSTPSLVVQVGSGGSLHRAPGGPYSLTNAPRGAAGPFDVVGHKRVDQGDVSETAVAWGLAHQGGTPCSNLAKPAADVNHDGCVDVADVQTVAANYTPSRRVRTAATASGGAVFTVTSTADASDTNIGDGICLATTGGCTLRAAIQEANVANGGATINFNIAGTGVHTIQLAGVALPTLSNSTGPITIDGYTQPGASPNTDPLVDNATILVEIKGGGPGTGNGTTGYDAIPITSANNLIRGLAFYNLRRAIWITGSNGTGNIIVGNFIGTNAAGTFGLPGPRVTYASGIQVDTGAGNTQVGTAALADRNVISGNANHGVNGLYEGADSTTVYNNLIGLNPAGTAALPNQNHGVDLDSDASYSKVGGTAPGQRNVVSGNGFNGIEFGHGTMSTMNQAVGNYIGTDVNGNAGDNPQQCASSYTKNGEYGVHLEDGTNNDLVANNVIGNGVQGGIYLEILNTVGNTITNNRIGIGMNGNPIPNCQFGIEVGYEANYNKIGPGNIIAYNQEGIKTTTQQSVSNTITRNSIYGNTNYQDTTSGNGRGIDNDPLDANDPNPLDNEANWNNYSNHDLNWPVIRSASPYEVTGTACTAPVVPQPCTIEVFIAAPALPNYGQGQTFVGSGQTDENGNFTVFISGVQVGQALTATATDALGDTSEFGQNFVVQSGSPITPTPTMTATPSHVITEASDSFSRTLSGEWGNADIGGGYSLEAPARPAVDYNVNGAQGTTTVNSTGVYHSAYLSAVSVQDTDVSFRFATSTTDAVAYQFVYAVGRRVAAGTQYLVRVGFTPQNGVLLDGGYSISENITLFNNEIGVSGLTHTANTYYRVHAQFYGANPTTIRARVWLDGQPEPTTWQYTTTDSTAALQAPGAVGMRDYISSGASSLPTTFNFDDFLATTPNTNYPTSTPTATATQSPTATPTSTSTPTSTPTNTPTVTNTPTTTPTPGPTNTPTPTPSVNTYVSDSYSRNLTGSWGNADVGGTYTYYGTASDFNVNGAQGTMNLGTANTIRSAYLMGVSQRDIEGSFRVATNQLSVGGGQIAYLVARRVSDGNDYLVRLRFPTDGSVTLMAAKEVSGSAFLLGGEVTVSGLSHTANGYVRVRAQVTGANPTTVRIRAWADGTTEPTSWQYAATDSEPVLQTAGGLGLRAFVGNITNAPILFSFDDLLITNPVSPGAMPLHIVSNSQRPAPAEAEPLMTPRPKPVPLTP